MIKNATQLKDLIRNLIMDPRIQTSTENFKST